MSVCMCVCVSVPNECQAKKKTMKIQRENVYAPNVGIGSSSSRYVCITFIIIYGTFTKILFICTYTMCAHIQLKSVYLHLQHYVQ